MLTLLLNLTDTKSIGWAKDEYVKLGLLGRIW